MIKDYTTIVNGINSLRGKGVNFGLFKGGWEHKTVGLYIPLKFCSTKAHTWFLHLSQLPIHRWIGYSLGLPKPSSGTDAPFGLAAENLNQIPQLPLEYTAPFPPLSKHWNLIPWRQCIRHIPRGKKKSITGYTPSLFLHYLIAREIASTLSSMQQTLVRLYPTL